SDIYEATGATLAHLKKLAQLDLIRFGSEEVWRDPLADRDFVPAEAPLLTPDQARVWGRIKVEMMAGDDPEDDTFDDEDTETRRHGDTETTSPLVPPSSTPFLLHGVTGSGKTEIYMRAIDFALQRGQRAIVL